MYLLDESLHLTKESAGLSSVFYRAENRATIGLQAYPVHQKTGEKTRLFFHGFKLEKN